MSRRFISRVFFTLVFLLPVGLRAETPNFTFADGDATGCGDIFVAKVSTDNTTGVWVDGYPPRSGFGAVTDKGETKEIDLGPSAWFQVGLDVQVANGAGLSYCTQSGGYNYNYYGSSSNTSSPPCPSWIGTSGKATIRLYSESGSQYADITLTNVLFTSPDGKSSVVLPALNLTHAHVGWYMPG